MTEDWGVEAIQREHLDSWRGRKLWAIVDMPDGSYAVYHQDAQNVAPQSNYPTLRQAAARLLQLLGTGAVAPQTWPESVCIGHVEISKDEGTT